MINISIFLDGQQIGEFEGKEDTEISIGRSPGCIVRLPDTSVSRLHAIIRYTDENIWLIEKKTTSNTLLLNGEEIENAILEGGEEIFVSNFTLRINITENQEKLSLDAAMGTTDEDSTDKQFLENKEKSEITDTKEDGKTKIAKKVPVAFLQFNHGTATVERFVLEKKSTLIGRGSNCDIILFEKQCSRKHLELSKVGLTFYLKDLNTINGTYVNGEKIKTCELAPEDTIKIGDVAFTFDMESMDEDDNQIQGELQSSQFPIPVDDLEPLIPTDLQEKKDLSSMDENLEEDIEQEKNLIKKRWKQFQKLPKTKRYIILLLILALTPLVFVEDEEKNKIKSSNPRSYQNLSVEKKAAVRRLYKKILIAKEKGLYTEMLDNTTKLFKLVDNFRDVKFYEKEAKQQIKRQVILEEREKKAREERKIRAQILELEKAGKILFDEALNKPEKRIDLNKLIQKIYTIDPSNISAQTWQSKIAAKIEREREEKLEMERKTRIAKKAEIKLLEVKNMIKEKKYAKAIEAASILLESSPHRDEEYIEEVKNIKEEAQALLKSAILPLIKLAERNRKPGGDLVKSKESYIAILVMDPKNILAIQGLKDIHSMLHLRAKRLYAQAILAESVTSLDEALQKFKECIKVAPENDIYKKRCKAKIVKYEAFEGTK